MTVVEGSRPPGWVPAVGTGAGPAAPPPPGHHGPVAPRFAGVPVGVEPDQRSRVYLRLSTTAVGMIAIAALAVVAWLVTDAEPHLAIAVALLVALGVDLCAARQAIGQVHLRVHGPGLAHAGEPTEWLVRVDGARRPVTLTPALAGQRGRVLVDDARPGRVTLAPFVLGVIHHLTFDVITTGPVGLVRAGSRHQVTPTIPVPVGPRPLELAVDWPKPRAVGFGFSEVAPLGDDLFRSIRPYVRGDDRRRVHWKATAHHGELMVRESEGTGLVALQVVVDLRHPGPGAERAAGWAAHLATQAIGKGWLVQLVTLDAHPIRPRITFLGSPFGGPPVLAPPVQVPVEPRSHRVTTARAVNHQLATAAYGETRVPPWPGLTCVVGEGGPTWR